MGRSKYSQMRSNIVRQQKRLLAKGYHINTTQNLNPPKVSELGHTPTEEDLLNLQKFREEVIPQYKYTATDYMGNKKELSYYEAQKYFRQEAKKKEKLTKMMKQFEKEGIKPPKPPTEDEISFADMVARDLGDINFIKEDIVNYDNILKKIGELVGYKSSSKNDSRRRKNEELVNGIGTDLLDAFQTADAQDHDGLVRRLSENAMTVTSCLDRAKTAYLEKDNGQALKDDLISIILGRNQTIEEAKKSDTGYDSPMEDEEYPLDENGEIIEV